MKFLAGWGFILLIAGVLFGCRSTKRIQTAISKKDSTTISGDLNTHADSVLFMSNVYSRLMENRISYTSFSARIKTEFQGSDGKRSDFNAHVRMYKDSLIWVSVNAVLGIEAFRILITPDSVKVLNKIDKLVQLRSVNYLQEVTRIPFSFYDLQDLIIGNPVYLDSNLISYKEDPGTITLISTGEIFKNLLSLNSSDYTINNSKLDDIEPGRARTAHILYGNYVNRNNMKFSTTRKINVVERKTLEINMEFRQFEFNEQLNFPFNIPKNYISN